MSRADFAEIRFTYAAALRYTDYMFDNKHKLYGKFVCSKSDAELKNNQIARTIVLSLALAFFVVPPLCLKSLAILLFTEKNYTPLVTAYVILLLFTAAMLVYTLAASLTRYRLRREIPEKYAPRSGFDKRTFACFEWSRVMTVIVAVAYAAMCAYAYSGQSVALAALECLAAALAVYARKITFDAYSSSLTLVSAEDAIGLIISENPTGETEDNPSDKNKVPVRQPETRLKTYNPDAAKNLSDEVEDFYDDKD